MSPQAEVTKTTYSGVRITVSAPHPFDIVLSKLHASIGSEPNWPSAASLATKESFSEFVKATAGSHDFMNFYEMSHGTWISLFGVGDGLKVRRVVLGNPLIAITMLRHDLESGLFLPVELLLVENEDRTSTKVIYDLPSALVTAVNENAALMDAAKVLDDRLAVLVDHIAS